MKEAESLWKEGVKGNTKPNTVSGALFFFFLSILAQVAADRQRSTNSSGIFPITHMREKLSAQHDEMMEREAINCSASINCKSPVVCQE